MELRPELIPDVMVTVELTSTTTIWSKSTESISPVSISVMNVWVSDYHSSQFLRDGSRFLSKLWDIGIEISFAFDCTGVWSGACSDVDWSNFHFPVSSYQTTKISSVLSSECTDMFGSEFTIVTSVPVLLIIHIVIPGNITYYYRQRHYKITAFTIGRLARL